MIHRDNNYTPFGTEYVFSPDEKTTGQKFSGEKAPIYTFCLQFREAIEKLALRSLYGHKKYIETDHDWKNFERVENPDYEYSNASFRHALGLGEDTELDHYVASAWNAIARLQLYIKNNLDNS